MQAHRVLIGEILSGKRLVDENRFGSRLRLWSVGFAALAGLSDAAVSFAAFTTAFVASAEAKSAGVNTRPASMGMCIVRKKPSPTRSVAVLAFDLGGAPSRCTSPADRLPTQECVLGITGGHHTGQRFEPLLQLPVEIDRLAIFVSRQAGVNAEEQNVLRIETRIECLQLMQGTH